jgi:hypothetical protein
MIAVVFRDAAVAEHQELLGCALNRDAKNAQTVLSTHIMDCVMYTLSNTKAMQSAPQMLGQLPVSLSAPVRIGPK